MSLLNIRIKTPLNKTLQVPLSAAKSVGSLKTLIGEQMKVSKNLLIIQYQDKELSDSDYLTGLNLDTESEIICQILTQPIGYLPSKTISNQRVNQQYDNFSQINDSYSTQTYQEASHGNKYHQDRPPIQFATSQSIDERRKNIGHSVRVIYPQKRSKNKAPRMVETSDSSEGDSSDIVHAPIKTMASISASLPPISGSAKYNSISDFPDIPYSVISTKCLGELYSDRICFKLSPHVAKIYCPFNYQKSEENQIILSIVPTIVSLPLEINGQGIIYAGEEIDITDRMRNGDNHFVFNTMDLIVTVVASVQWRMSQNYDFLVRKIIEEHPPMPLQSAAQFITDSCPLSHSEIKYPGRGCNCTHAQCFDLYTFLKNAKETGNWGCPVCGLTLSMSSLRYDPEYLKNCSMQMIGDDFFSLM